MESDDLYSTSMNVSLPKALQMYVEERVTNSAYTSASEVVREFIRQDRDRRTALDRTEQLLLEGLASGPATAWTQADWTALRERVAARHSGQNSAS